MKVSKRIFIVCCSVIIFLKITTITFCTFYATEKIKLIKKQVDENKRQQTELQSQLNTNEKQKTKLQETNANLQKQVDENKRQQTELQEELNNILDEKNKEIAKLQEELNNILDEKNKEIAKLQYRNANLQKQINLHKTEIGSKENKINTLTKNNTAIQNLNKQLHAKINLVNRKTIKNMTENLQERKNKFEYSSSEKEKEQLQEEIRDLESEIAELNYADFFEIPISNIKRNLLIEDQLFHIIAMSVGQYRYKNMSFEKQEMTYLESDENKRQEIPMATASLIQFISKNELNYKPENEVKDDNFKVFNKNTDELIVSLKTLPDFQNVSSLFTTLKNLNFIDLSKIRQYNEKLKLICIVSYWKYRCIYKILEYLNFGRINDKQNRILNIIAMSVRQYGYKNMSFEKQEMTYLESDENKRLEIPMATDSTTFLLQFILKNELEYHPKNKEEITDLNNYNKNVKKLEEYFEINKGFSSYIDSLTKLNFIDFSKITQYDEKIKLTSIVSFWKYYYILDLLQYLLDYSKLLL